MRARWIGAIAMSPKHSSTRPMSRRSPSRQRNHACRPNWTIPLLAKDVSCLERVENESDRQLDEHELRPGRRCVSSTSTPAISTVTSAKRRLTHALPL